VLGPTILREIGEESTFNRSSIIWAGSISIVLIIISTTMGCGINRESYNAIGFEGSSRNAAEIAGSTSIVAISGSLLCLLADWLKSSVAGLFREISSIS